MMDIIAIILSVLVVISFATGWLSDCWRTHWL